MLVRKPYYYIPLWQLFFAFPNSSPGSGNTALFEAAEHGCIDVARLLVEAGADRNLRTRSGITAAMCAAENGYAEMAQLLSDA